MKLSLEGWTVLRLGRGPIGRWVAVPPTWSGEWNEVGFFNTQPEAFKYAFEECTDRRGMFGALIDDAVLARGSCRDMEMLVHGLVEEGWSAKLMVCIDDEWVEPWP